MERPVTETSWSLIDAAAEGEMAARDRFVRTYRPFIERALLARWGSRAEAMDVEDALQEIFLDCFRHEGALTRANPERGGFRAFLFGVTRHVALRFEERLARRKARQLAAEPEPEWLCPLPQAFDRSWAISILEEARVSHRAWAERRGDAALRRVRLLELRFRDHKSGREIASELGLSEKGLEKAAALARREFEAILRQTIARHDPGDAAHLDDECRALLKALS